VVIKSNTVFNLYSQETSALLYAIDIHNTKFTGKINIEKNEIYSITRGYGIFIGLSLTSTLNGVV